MDANFDWKTYVNNYEDLQKADINTAEKAWMHWTMYGKYEDRTLENIDEMKFINNYENFDNFDWFKYMNNYPELKFNSKEKAWKHWIAYGKRENKMSCFNNNTNVIIYVLCYNEEVLNNVKQKQIYNNYSWSKLIIMKYQDFTFENAFWKQLLEIEHEWSNCKMVGTISYSAYKKINLDYMDKIIKYDLYEPSSYYHFMDSKIQIPNINTNTHPYFNIIWNDIIKKLDLINTTESCCNYWMCKPKIMKEFINWYLRKTLPTMINNKYIFEDAKYTGWPYNNNINKDLLIKTIGMEYYPHFPFIQERLNKCFFIKNYKLVFLISHDRNKNGAVNALLNLELYYRKINIKTVFLHLDEITNINIVKYIYDKSNEFQCSPIVICNTFFCCKIVNKLINTTIPIFWYIHEWYEPNGYFSYIKLNSHLFGSRIHFIFVCESSYLNYKTNFPNLKDNYLIVNNGYSANYLEAQSIQSLEKEFIKNDDDIIISIIGTIEKRKNQQEFINKVFYKCKDKYKNIKLLLVGNEMEKIIIDETYAKSVYLMGYVKNAISYINISDIIISYSNNEVLPLNIIESFYCAKPVIATNVGGVSEIITDNYNGFLIIKNDYEECLNKLSQLIEDESLRNYFGSNARKTFYDKFEENITMEKFELILSFPPNLN